MPVKLLGILISAFLLCNGLLMLVSPRNWARLYTWYSGVSRLSDPHPSASLKRGPRLGIRVPGLIMTIGGIFFVYGMARAIVTHAHVERRPSTNLLPRGGGHHCLLLTTGLGALIGGVWILIRPGGSIRFMLDRWPERRIIREEALPAWKIRVRIGGAALMAWGTLAVRTWLKMSH